jgi:hypothetical protein
MTTFAFRQAVARREGWHMDWPLAAVLIALIFALMVVASTYYASRAKR